MVSKKAHITAILFAVAAMAFAIFVLFHSQVAHGAQRMDVRPDKVSLKTPRGSYGFACGSVHRAGRFIFAFVNCRLKVHP